MAACISLRALRVCLVAMLYVAPVVHARAQPPPPTAPLATAVPLMLPRGLAYDSLGNLFFAETGGHVIRRVSPDGFLRTAAGTGTQGFSGDGGPATSAALDSPSALVIDGADNVLFSDTHNHRIRRIDAVSGTITTVAGTGIAGISPDGVLASNAELDLPSALALDTAGDLFFADALRHVIRRIDAASNKVTTVAGDGTQGFRGDGGPALSAALDTPWGLALNAAGDLYLADTHNHRVRRVDHLTQLITSVAGDGLPRFGGDDSSANLASLNLPRGLTVDSAGNLFVVDARNHRVRRIDAVSGVISTIAGEGTELFAGDESPALSASLDSPSAATLSPAGLLVFSDTASQRVREIDSAAVIHTLAGLASASLSRLTLSAPAVIQYGTGSVAATFSPGGPTGPAIFIDLSSGVTQLLPAVAFAGDIATLDTSTLVAGAHHISASYSGDPLHGAVQSASLNITIMPAPLLVKPNSLLLLYGQPIPPLTATSTGLLPQDSASIVISLSSTAAPLASPASFPITTVLSGSSAGNYTLTAAPGFVTISKASPVITLSDALAVHVGSPAAGTPGGNVTLLDGASTYAAATLSKTGDATFSPANLSSGSHTLTAVYAGDADFIAATSPPAFFSAAPTLLADFLLTPTSPVLLSVNGGATVIFSFNVSPTNGGLSSPILLTAAGLPPGASPSFSPAYIPPSSTDLAFTLTIQTIKLTALEPESQSRSFAWATLVPLAFLLRRSSRRYLRGRLQSSLLQGVLFAGVLFTGVLGCGDRTTAIATGPAPRTSVITVLATGTSLSGATVQHTATVTLITQ